MTFCKDMSSRLEEPFCKNICSLGIDTSYCSDLYMFLIRLNHLIAVLAISEKAPAHSLDTSQWRGFLRFFWWVVFLLGVVLAEDGQRSFASCKCDDVHGYLMSFFCTCSFVLNFYFCFWYSCDNTNARHHKRSSGRQWGQRSKNTKNINQTKRWKKMESLQKGCLKINESGKTRNREPEVVSLQNDAWKRHLKSQLLIKRSLANVRLPYSEESRHLIKWGGCLKSNEGAKTLCFL